MKSPSARRPQPEEPVARSRFATRAVPLACLFVWLALAAACICQVVQERWGELHPTCVPFLVFVGLAFVAAIAGLVCAGWRIARGNSQWRRLVGWSLAISLPFLLFAIPFVQARHQWSDFQVPHSRLGRLVIVTAVGLMEMEARFYPHQEESDRLVMFYQKLDHPRPDIETMDHHVARLEAKLDAPLRTKIHWVRGWLLGQGNCSLYGLALGTSQSPTNWEGVQGNLDRHELAHAVLTQQRPISADPPMVLHEGWAEAQSGRTHKELNSLALQGRAAKPGLTVGDLFKPEWYHRDEGPVYWYGGAFVDFLLERFSTAKFVELYNRCQMNTFEADIEAIYGQSLAELEGAFWEHVSNDKQ